MNGNPSILVTEQVFVRGTCDTNPGPWSGQTTEGAAEITDSLFGLVEPSIVGQPEWGRTSCPARASCLSPARAAASRRTPTTLSPGVYYGGIVISGQAQVRFNPGVYYIAGGGIQYQGNASSAFEVIGGTGGDPGRALFFSTGDPAYGGVCALDPTFPQNSPPQFGLPDGDLTLGPAAVGDRGERARHIHDNRGARPATGGRRDLSGLTTRARQRRITSRSRSPISFRPSRRRESSFGTGMGSRSARMPSSISRSSCCKGLRSSPLSPVGHRAITNLAGRQLRATRGHRRDHQLG